MERNQSISDSHRICDECSSEMYLRCSEFIENECVSYSYHCEGCENRIDICPDCGKETKYDEIRKEKKTLSGKDVLTKHHERSWCNDHTPPWTRSWTWEEPHRPLLAKFYEISIIDMIFLIAIYIILLAFAINILFSVITKLI